MGATVKNLESQLVLTAEQVESFDRDGYLTLRGITTADDLAKLRDIYERMFRDKTGLADGNYFDLSAGGEEVTVLPQITRMASYEPKLRHSLLWRNIGAVSRQLLGETADYVFDHGIRKPPNGPKTPWHQDFAYYGPGIRHRCVTFWVPLHDATVENGCMWFVPGSHRGTLLEHHPINGDPRIHGLEIRDAEFGQLYPADLRSLAGGTVSCPIRAGDCTVHNEMTIHGTGPNMTDEPRLAYALAFGVRMRRSRVTKDYPWNAVKQTLRAQRQQQSLGPITKLKNAARTVLARARLF
jgi:ectoine hydroxylase-related dioxygenase (phytanoyl-CoA dioxygenase family)